MAGGVFIFLLVSGYGLAISANRKGVNSFWRKKFVRVFLPWMIVWLIVRLFNADSFQPRTILSLFTPNWFLQYLFVCYVVFYLCFKWAYQYRLYLLSFFALMTFCFWGNIQAEQCCSFQIGVLLAENRNIFVYVKKSIKILLLVSMIMFLMTLGIKQIECVRMFIENHSVAEHTLNLILKSSLGICVIASCTIGYKYINSKYVQLIGRMSYELYLVHMSLVLVLCKEIGEGPIISLAIYVILSFLGSLCLYAIDSKILKFYSRNLEKE